MATHRVAGREVDADINAALTEYRLDYGLPSNTAALREVVRYMMALTKTDRARSRSERAGRFRRIAEAGGLDMKEIDALIAEDPALAAEHVDDEPAVAANGRS